MLEFLKILSEGIWGGESVPFPPLVILLFGTGLWLTWQLRGIQFLKLGHALWLAFIERDEKNHASEKNGPKAGGDISHFQALMTALAATVGTGNIAGVAIAISVGGPGALFWMWVTGLLGMATKYGEAILAVRYRVTNSSGQYSGGPMYYIERGLGWKPLAILFAMFTALAALGIGNMVQSNSVAGALEESFSLPAWGTGITLSVLTFLVIIGGIREIGRVTSVVVPFMVALYMGAAVVILILMADKIPAAFAMIFRDAFSGSAATGGFLGAGVMQAISLGTRRGIFSNESGLGSAPIAAAAARTNHPVRQALVSMTQTFIDTLIVCTMTGLVLIITGAWSESPAVAGKGAALTGFAFGRGLGTTGTIIVTISLVFFAYSTLIGWSYYGEKAVEYLLGSGVVRYYRLLFVGFVYLGAVRKLDTVWAFSDVMNGLMAFPNLLALLLLSKVIVGETRRYLDRDAAPD